MKLLVIPLLFLLGISCTTNSSQSASDGYIPQDLPSVNFDLNLKVEKFVLSNGLTLLISKNSRLPIVSVFSFLKVGGKNETEGLVGVVHPRLVRSPNLDRLAIRAPDPTDERDHDCGQRLPQPIDPARRVFEFGGHG